jgi:hypothetical protein
MVGSAAHGHACVHACMHACDMLAQRPGTTTRVAWLILPCCGHDLQHAACMGIELAGGIHTATAGMARVLRT